MTNGRLVTLLAVLVVFATIALGGLVYMGRELDRTHSIATTLQYNAVRGDCIRRVTADAEQQFRVDLTTLITLGRSNPVAAKALIERMNNAAKVNYADVVLEVCPPAVKENT